MSAAVAPSGNHQRDGIAGQVQNYEYEARHSHQGDQRLGGPLQDEIRHAAARRGAGLGWVGLARAG